MRAIRAQPLARARACPQSFVASGNIQYFQCTIKGCDVTKPVALTLTYPTVVPTHYAATIPVVIPQPKKTVRPLPSDTACVRG